MAQAVTGVFENSRDMEIAIEQLKQIGIPQASLYLEALRIFVPVNRDNIEDVEETLVNQKAKDIKRVRVPDEYFPEDNSSNGNGKIDFRIFPKLAYAKIGAKGGKSKSRKPNRKKRSKTNAK